MEREVPALGGITAMLLKLAPVLINLCDQRNLIHSLKNNIPWYSKRWYASEDFYSNISIENEVGLYEKYSL